MGSVSINNSIKTHGYASLLSAGLNELSIVGHFAVNEVALLDIENKVGRSNSAPPYTSKQQFFIQPFRFRTITMIEEFKLQHLSAIIGAHVNDSRPRPRLRGVGSNGNEPHRALLGKLLFTDLAWQLRCWDRLHDKFICILRVKGLVLHLW